MERKGNFFTRNKALTAIWGILLLICIGVGLGSSNTTNTSDKTAASSNNSSSTNKPASELRSQATTTTAAQTPAQKVGAWYTNYGTIFTLLSNDLTAIGTDAGNQNIAGLNADCVQLQTDLTTAQNDPAIPDTNTEDHWSAGIADDNAGAQACIDGTNNDDASEIEEASTDFTTGNSEVLQAAQAIKAL
jgi:hypothetical protein